MAQDITLQGATYPSVPAVVLPKSGGGSATFYDLNFTAGDVNWWEKGGLASADATDTSTTSRMRTGYFSQHGLLKIEPLSGYKVGVFVFNADGTYQGVWTGSAAEKSMTWLTDAVDTADLPSGCLIRLVGSSTTDATINSSNIATFAANILLTCYTDTTLTRRGYAADAKGVEDAIDYVCCYRGLLSSGADADDLTKYGLYRWTSTNTPTNAPETAYSNLMCFAPNGATSQVAQLVFTQTNHVYYRWMTSSGFQSWHRLGEAVKSDTITTTTTWSGSDPYTQTVTLTTNTPTSNTVVGIQLDDNAYDQLKSDGVGLLRIDNNNGTLTAVARGAAPTAALTLQVTLTEGV